MFFRHLVARWNKLVTFHPRRLPMCDCSTTPPLDSVPSLATHLLTMWQIPPRPGTWCPFRIAGRCIHMGGGRRTRPVARSGCNLPPRRRTRNVKGWYLFDALCALLITVILIIKSMWCDFSCEPDEVYIIIVYIFPYVCQHNTMFWMSLSACDFHFTEKVLKKGIEIRHYFNGFFFGRLKFCSGPGSEHKVIHITFHNQLCCKQQCVDCWVIPASIVII